MLCCTILGGWDAGYEMMVMIMIIQVVVRSVRDFCLGLEGIALRGFLGIERVERGRS